jgi:thiopeptide-type bacteriocin biosynthesis protein
VSDSNVTEAAPGSATDDWLSVYLFFEGWIYAPECDQVVRELVEPFAARALREGWADGHFFIRYSEHGPHVRLRLHGDPAMVASTVWPALVEHVRARHPEVAVDRLPDTPVYQPREGNPPVRVTHLARVAYEPETERYGGPHALTVAERLFEDSSRSAWALMTHMGDQRSARLGKGLLAMVVLVHTFVRDRAHGASFAQMYSGGYLRSVAREDEGREAWIGAFDQGYEQQAETLGAYVDEVWSRMDDGDPLSDALDAWAAALRLRRGELRALADAGKVHAGGVESADWDRTVASIVPSYVHMMNNRLGITIQEESYLGYLIARALGRTDAAPQMTADQTAS